MFHFEVARVRCSPVTFESSTNIYTCHQSPEILSEESEITEHRLNELGNDRVDMWLALTDRQDCDLRIWSGFAFRPPEQRVRFAPTRTTASHESALSPLHLTHPTLVECIGTSRCAK